MPRHGAFLPPGRRRVVRRRKTLELSSALIAPGCRPVALARNPSPFEANGTACSRTARRRNGCQTPASGVLIPVRFQDEANGRGVDFHRMEESADGRSPLNQGKHTALQARRAGLFIAINRPDPKLHWSSGAPASACLRGCFLNFSAVDTERMPVG